MFTLFHDFYTVNIFFTFKVLEMFVVQNIKQGEFKSVSISWLSFRVSEITASVIFILTVCTKVLRLFKILLLFGLLQNGVHIL
jgi:hypothetical protein